MARRPRPVEGQRTFFDPDADERDEPASGLDRSTSDEHPERERESRTIHWREWVLDRIAFPDVVEVPSNGKRPPTVSGSAMARTLLAIYELSLGRRGVTLRWSDLADEAGLSDEHTKRVATVLEHEDAIVIHRRSGKSRPHTFELRWPRIRRLVPGESDEEPDEFQPPHVCGPAPAQPAHQRGHQPPRGTAPTSSLRNEMNGMNEGGAGDWLGHVEADDLRNAEWLAAMLRRAVDADVLPDDETSREFVHEVAEYALAKGGKPGGLFRRIVQNGQHRWRMRETRTTETSTRSREPKSRERNPRKRTIYTDDPAPVATDGARG